MYFYYIQNWFIMQLEKEVIDMKKVDMHMHSIYSDGSKNPHELLNMARSLNIGTMALTDHDNIEGSKILLEEQAPDMEIFSGVELTAKVPKGRMHILGYNIDLENHDLNDTLQRMKEASIYNMLLYIEILKKDFGIALPQDEVDRLLSATGNIGRPHLALLLIKLGICKDVDEAFDNYLTYAYKKVSKIKKGLTKEECVELINGAGGTAVLAHPVSLKLNNDELDREVAYLKSLGLSGIEIIHIHTKPKDRKYYHHLAQKYDLLISGGTDYHGEEVKPDVLMGSGINGNVEIYEDTLTLTKNIKNRYRH